MVDLQPQPYTTASPVVATFDFSDISNGVGYETFYGMTTGNSAVTNYILSPDALYSDTTQTLSATITAQTTWAKMLDLDFDTSTFNLAKTINGDVVIEVTHGSVTTNSVYRYLVFNLYRYDGTEHLLGTVQAGDGPPAGGTNNFFTNSTQSDSSTLVMPITNGEIAAGDLVRLTVEVWGYRIQADGKVMMAHSPKNVDTSDITPSTQNSTHTDFRINIPYKLDL